MRALLALFAGSLLSDQRVVHEQRAAASPALRQGLSLGQSARNHYLLLVCLSSCVCRVADTRVRSSEVMTRAQPRVSRLCDCPLSTDDCPGAVGGSVRLSSAPARTRPPLAAALFLRERC